MKEIRLAVPDMSCEHCVRAVKEALQEVDEVKEVRVSLDSKSAEVKAGESVDTSSLEEAVKEAGYTPEVVG